MTPRDRFYATIERAPVDRPAAWLGQPVPAAIPALLRHFGVRTLTELSIKLGDDIHTVEMPYRSPTSNAIYSALNFAKQNPHATEADERTLTAPGFFEDYSDPTEVARFDWPDPALYIDRDLCRRLVEQTPPGHPVMGIIWSAHFQDACAAFGMETALIKMLTEPDMFRAVIDRILKFYLRANEIFFEATKGKLNACLIGNDFGSQHNLMVGPEPLRQFVFDGTRQLIAQAKSYGLKVIHHSCGAISSIIPDLIACGADAIHPIQALATGMEPHVLKKQYGNKVSFCGGVDAQELLVNGTPKQVTAKVRELREIFPTGLIISPSHEAILPDVPPANIAALFAGLRD